MYQLILMLHVFVAVFIVALVLVQQGKGATMGAAFGSGASQTIFGSRGSGSFLYRLTIGFAAIFFMTNIGLNYLTTRAYKAQQKVTAPFIPLSSHQSPAAPLNKAADATTPHIPERVTTDKGTAKTENTEEAIKAPALNQEKTKVTESKTDAPVASNENKSKNVNARQGTKKKSSNKTHEKSKGN